DGAAVAIEVERPARLADLGHGAEAEGLEQVGQPVRGLGPVGEPELDLLARLGRPPPLGTLVGDPVLLPLAPDAQGLIRPGEIAGRVREVAVDLLERSPGRGAPLVQAPGQRLVVRHAELDLDLEAHETEPTPGRRLRSTRRGRSPVLTLTRDGRNP